MKFGATHYALGMSHDSPCGIVSLWHRGLKYTRDPLQVSCQRCIRWLRKEAHRQDVPMSTVST